MKLSAAQWAAVKASLHGYVKTLRGVKDFLPEVSGNSIPEVTCLIEATIRDIELDNLTESTLKDIVQEHCKLSLYHFNMFHMDKMKYCHECGKKLEGKSELPMGGRIPTP